MLRRGGHVLRKKHEACSRIHWQEEYPYGGENTPERRSYPAGKGCGRTTGAYQIGANGGDFGSRGMPVVPGEDSRKTFACQPRSQITPSSLVRHFPIAFLLMLRKCLLRKRQQGFHLDQREGTAVFLEPFPQILLPMVDDPLRRFHPPRTHIPHLHTMGTLKKISASVINPYIKNELVRTHFHGYDSTDISYTRLCPLVDYPSFNSHGECDDPCVSLPPGAGCMKCRIKWKR